MGGNVLQKDLRIGFIGLGVMGFPMAENLKQKTPNSTMYIYDKDERAVARLLLAIPTVRVLQSSRAVADNAVSICGRLPFLQYPIS
jgi:3-hydroxyisobutyrate dehydrogenase-like beta-hydroxyacid dehydrogenase